MSVRFNTFVMTSGRKSGDGAIEYVNGEIVVYLKSAVVGAMFGILGKALSQGKEILRFPLKAVANVTLQETSLADYIHVDVNDGRFLSFKRSVSMPEEFLTALQIQIEHPAPSKKLVFQDIQGDIYPAQLRKCEAYRGQRETLEAYLLDQAAKFALRPPHIAPLLEEFAPVETPSSGFSLLLETEPVSFSAPTPPPAPAMDEPLPPPMPAAEDFPATVPISKEDMPFPATMPMEPEAPKPVSAPAPAPKPAPAPAQRPVSAPTPKPAPKPVAPAPKPASAPAPASKPAVPAPTPVPKPKAAAPVPKAVPAPAPKPAAPAAPRPAVPTQKTAVQLDSRLEKFLGKVPDAILAECSKQANNPAVLSDLLLWALNGKMISIQDANDITEVLSK